MPNFHFKKHLPILSFLFIPFFSFSQGGDFAKVDDYVASFKKEFVDVPTLAKDLTEPFSTDVEKARALFMWLAHNVRYDCKKFHNPKQPEIRARSKKELEAKIAAQKQKEIVRAAKYKRGVCQDYSDLFKAMSDAVGLEAVVIVGNARHFYNPFRSSHRIPHAWNAVKIDGQWHLLDATWGAGYTDPAVRKFTRKVSPGHFMTPPEWFAQTHLPDDPNWQLLEQRLDKSTFSTQPVINYGQQKYGFIDFSKTIESDNSGSKMIRIKMGNVPKYFGLATAKGRPIKFTHKKEEGYEVFRFNSRGGGTLVVFGGASQKMMDWLAKYDL